MADQAVHPTLDGKPRKKLPGEMNHEELKAHHDDKPFHEWPPATPNFGHLRVVVDGNHPDAASMRTEGADIPAGTPSPDTTVRGRFGEKIVPAGEPVYSTGSNEPVPEPGQDDEDTGAYLAGAPPRPKTAKKGILRSALDKVTPSALTDNAAPPADNKAEK